MSGKFPMTLGEEDGNVTGAQRRQNIERLSVKAGTDIRKEGEKRQNISITYIIFKRVAKHRDKMKEMEK